MEVKEVGKMDTLLGFVEAVAVKRDGTSEMVRVLQLGVEHYPSLIDLLAGRRDELAALELYCNRPAGWAKTLTPAAHHELMEKANELNAAFFVPWARRQVALSETLAPGMTERIASAASTLQSTSPKSRLPAG
jgi:hypothetical protein